MQFEAAVKRRGPTEIRPLCLVCGAVGAEWEGSDDDDAEKKSICQKNEA